MYVNYKVPSRIGVPIKCWRRVLEWVDESETGNLMYKGNLVFPDHLIKVLPGAVILIYDEWVEGTERRQRKLKYYSAKAVQIDTEGGVTEIASSNMDSWVTELLDPIKDALRNTLNLTPKEEELANVVMMLPPQSRQRIIIAVLNASRLDKKILERAFPMTKPK